MKFRTILADPPWDFRNRVHGSEKNHYGTMTNADIAGLSVSAVAEESCTLLLW